MFKKQSKSPDVNTTMRPDLVMYTKRLKYQLLDRKITASQLQYCPNTTIIVQTVVIESVGF